MGHHRKKNSQKDYRPEPMQNPNPPSPFGNIDIGAISNLIGNLDLSKLSNMLGNIDMSQVSSMLSKMNQNPQGNVQSPPEGSNNNINNNPLNNINPNDLNSMLKNIDMNQVSSMISQITGGQGGSLLDMGKPKPNDYRIGVLNSLKPFLPEDKCSMIDEIVKYLTLKTAIDKVKGSKSKS